MMRAPKNYAICKSKPWRRIKRLIIAKDGLPITPSATFASLEGKRLPIRRITNHRRWPIQPRRNLPAVAQVKRCQPNLFHAHHATATNFTCSRAAGSSQNTLNGKFGPKRGCTKNRLCVGGAKL